MLSIDMKNTSLRREFISISECEGYISDIQWFRLDGRKRIKFKLNNACSAK